MALPARIKTSSYKVIEDKVSVETPKILSLSKNKPYPHELQKSRGIFVGEVRMPAVL